MADIKIVLGNKDGKSYQTSVDNNSFLNKKISDKISDVEGFSGYEFEISGGSDKDGFPMRKDLDGVGRRRLLLTKGPGVKISIRGNKKRKLMRGNTISEDTSQVNLKVLKEGKKSLAEMLGKKEEAPKEEQKEK